MKNKVYLIAAGTVMFVAGIFTILYLNAVWGPMLIFLGAASICSAAGFSIRNWHEALTSYPASSHEPMPHESAFLARLYLSLSWVARNCGILELERFMSDKEYKNSLYHMGKNMVLDGICPDFITETLENAISLIHERSNVRVRFLRQLGNQLRFIGLFVGLSGAFAYGVRWINNMDVSTTGISILFSLVAISFIMCVVFSILLPDKIKGRAYQLKQTQKQMLRGILSLQAGDSYRAIIMSQYSFLSVKDREQLIEDPMFPEVKELNPNGNYDDVVKDIRRIISGIVDC